jgi:2-keto-4-pentenoate hydratase
MNQAVEIFLALRAGLQPRPVALPAAVAPQNEDEAYVIQLQVLKRLGAYVGGWKASMPDTASGWSAPIPTVNLLREGAPLAPPALRTAGSRRIGIEPEVAFTLARALPAGPTYTRVQVLQAVASAHAAIELCDCRLADFDTAPLLDRLADNLMNEGLVLSAASPDWKALELKSLPLRVIVNGEVVHQALGGHALVDPLIPLVWIANHLSQRGIGLQAGDVVTTGSYAGCRWVAPDSKVTVEFADLGAATVQL